MSRSLIFVSLFLFFVFISVGCQESETFIFPDFDWPESTDGDGYPSEEDAELDVDFPDSDDFEAVDGDGDQEMDPEIEEQEIDEEEITEEDEEILENEEDTFSCSLGQAYNPETEACVDCDISCEGSGLWGFPYRETTLSGNCICETLSGFFLANEDGTLAEDCDKDDDGWISLAAREHMIAEEDNPIQQNWRCDLRQIESVTLVEENGMETVFPITNFGVNELPLWEPEEIDDPEIFSPEPYGETGRSFTAKEVNSFTKACQINADYNGNGIKDTEERQDPAGALPVLAMYTNFSYFLELHQGYYENGTYRISEKSRSGQEGSSSTVPMQRFDGGISNYWKYCLRMADASYEDGTLPVGMDFIQFDQTNMVHHSQFKCIEIVDELPETAENSPQKMTLEQATSSYQLNSCKTTADSEQIGPGINPQSPVITCEEAENPDVGDVFWGVVNYLDYPTEDRSSYERGCINECEEQDMLADENKCSALIDDPLISASCDGDPLHYGFLRCFTSLVFVAKSGFASDSNAGTYDAPLLTINAALEKVRQSPILDTIIVGEGRYEENITLEEGVHLVGGYINDSDWQRTLNQTVDIIPAGARANGDIIGIRIEDIAENTILEQVRIEIPDNTTPGASNYGLWVSNSDNSLRLRSLAIDMGRAGDGADGLVGGNGKSGIQGNNGIAGCAISISCDCATTECCICGTAGLAPEPQNCQYGQSPGLPGNGGRGSCCTGVLACGETARTGEDASDQIITGGTHYGEGGSPSSDTDPMQTSTSGTNGMDGSIGQNGAGGTSLGMITQFGAYSTADGFNGTNGRQGTSGGGGGGGYTPYDTGDECYASGGGGSGGSGGCGGSGGQGGQGGGGNFGIFTFNSTPRIEHCTIYAGVGGRGGLGAAGGSGGNGGNGGNGATGIITDPEESPYRPRSSGSSGGSGGDGGEGGIGGGGGGGPSFCYFAAGSGIPNITTSACYPAQGGIGGQSAGNNGLPGLNGLQNF